MRLSQVMIGSAVIALLLAGCTTTGSIAPQYVSPDKYSSKSCDELSYEINRVSQLATAKEKEQSGLSASGVGIGIAGGRHGIYPTISFGVGKSNSTNNKKNALSTLYGEHDAMVLAARQKNCTYAHQIKIYGE